MNRNKKEGFTLIELLVVVAIIGLLASVVIASLTSARSKGRDARRLADVRQIQTALALYVDTNGQYPMSGGAVDPNPGWSNSREVSWTTLQTALLPYISSLPKDPINSGIFSQSGGFLYAFYDGGNYSCPQRWYMLVYQLENAKGVDPGASACDGSSWQYGGSGANTNIKTVGDKY